jgi:hypothetical protein
MIAGLPPFYDRNRPTMYRKILDAPLEKPKDMTADAFDLCSKMLHREPTQRLGYRGAAEIMAHPFFAGLDWDRLSQKEIRPPWVPTVSDETDTRNIAKEFVNEQPGITPSPMGTRLRDVMGTGTTPPAFTDFTYTHHGLDGHSYRVSHDEFEGDAALTRDGFGPATAARGDESMGRTPASSNASSQKEGDAGESGAGDLPPDEDMH